MSKRQHNSKIIFVKTKIQVLATLAMIYVLGALLPINILNAQDLIFSQYYSAPIHINSAFTGIVSYPNFNANYRLQWPGFSRTYETYAVSYDQFFKKKNIGLGAIALVDDQGEGTLQSTRLKGLISYNLQFNKDWQLKFGTGIGYVQNRLDWDKLIFFDQLDVQFGAVDRFGNPNISSEVRPNSLNNGYFDIDFGFLLYNPRYYIGFSMFHINGPYNGFLANRGDATASPELELPVTFSFQAGYQVVLERDNKGNPETFISPSILFANQSGFNQVNVGAYLQKNVIFGGLWLRHTLENIDALIVSAGVFTGNLKIGYSFDLTTSQLNFSNSRGSHEIAITMGLKQLEKKESKYNDCFSLFR